MQRIPSTIMATTLALVGCAAHDDGSDVAGTTAQEARPGTTGGAAAPGPGETRHAETRSAVDGTYHGELEPLNGSGVHGAARVLVMDDGITVTVVAEGLAPDRAHRQMIHVGDACPTMAADENGDGFLAVTEGLPSYGPVLVPLDDRPADLAEDTYPEADANGRLDYRQELSFADLAFALHQPDPDPDDPFVRLDPDEDLAFGARTVVVHGVAESRALPGSVQSIPGVPAHDSLPIACATLAER